jgi:cytochrome c oxidase assembly protein subunit 15
MKYPKAVIVWLWIGLFLVFMQIVIGGITRLTGSGLSITKWEIVTGTLPPMNAIQWEEAFELYKATPQYEKINEGMTMSSFKFIYFWEYFHRLWARMMGLVFLFPFIYFLIRKYLDKEIIRNLIRVILFAALAAVFGWIMVASGLIERPWVNAYKLSFHLIIGLCVFAALLWTIFQAQFTSLIVAPNKLFRTHAFVFISLLIIQIFFGGMMSGMKAGLFYPTWPLIDGGLFPQIIFQSAEWNVDNFNNYDQGVFMSALVQSIHRTIAYLLVIYGLFIVYKYRNSLSTRIPVYLFVAILLLQVLLGILTLINCKAAVPVGLGVYHQAGAILLLGISLFLVFINTKKGLSHKRQTSNE